MHFWKSIITRVVHFKSRNMASKTFCTSKQQNGSFVWIDLELTGLDLDKDVIMEVACIVTTPNLDVMHPGYHTEIHVEEDALQAMGPWCTKQHGKTGLTENCRNSSVTLQSAELQLRDYISKYTNKKDTLYMAGNTVYMDKFFVDKYMPLVSKMLHYRLIDVSTLKTLVGYWYPDTPKPRKVLMHRALSDIEESIEELKHYRQSLFK